MSEELNMRVFPVIENVETEYIKTVENHYKFIELKENQLVPPGVGDMVEKEELHHLRQKIVELALKYGFGNTVSTFTGNQNEFDREFSILLFNEMNITPSVAATIQSFYFINLKLIPDIIYWRWGDNKDRFIGRRYYSGTQWWRYYFFAGNKEGEAFYRKLSETEITDIFERPNTRGLENYAKNILVWFKELCKDEVVLNTRELFRSTIKKYNTELAYRNYFVFSDDERKEVFAECYSGSKNELL